MCRNIKLLANFEPPATEEEIRASALQFVRKLSGSNKPSKANEEAFNQALGVQCNHCHQFVGAGDPMNDMASDVKPQKNAARAMMRMVGAINPQVASGVSKTPETAVRVGCWTCHRGQAIPEAPPALPAPAGRGAPGGAPPAK